MKEKYIVKNYHSFISLPSEDDRKPIALDSGELNSLKPFTKKLTLEEIEYINLRSDLFKTGRIEFEEKDEKELFDHLDIYDESRIFRAREILDIVKKPTKEKLEKVIAIKDLNTIDLFRGIVVSFRNLGTVDLSNRVLTVINKRRNEIYKNPSAETKIVVKKTSDEVEMEAKEKAMEQALASTVAEMKKQFEAEYKKKLTAEKKKIKAELEKANKEADKE